MGFDLFLNLTWLVTWCVFSGFDCFYCFVGEFCLYVCFVCGLVFGLLLNWFTLVVLLVWWLFVFVGIGCGLACLIYLFVMDVWLFAWFVCLGGLVSHFAVCFLIGCLFG